jgi:hypothetical protein
MHIPKRDKHLYMYYGVSSASEIARYKATRLPGVAFEERESWSVMASEGFVGGDE